MATSLFKMPFDVSRLKVRRIYESSELSHCQVETMSCEKIREIYGDLKFLELMRTGPAPIRPWSPPWTGALPSPMLPRVP